MKILIMANNDIGLYKFRKELIMELINQNNEVFISLPNGDYINNLCNLGCIFYETDVDRRGINPIKDISLFCKYLSLINKIKPEKIITYTIKPNIYGGIAARILGIQYFSNITGLGSVFEKDNMVKKIVVNLYRIALRKAKTVFFENEYNSTIFKSLGICNSKQLFVLNGAGVNLEEYKYTELKNTDDNNRFLFVGRIMKEKGIEEFFEVAKRCKQEKLNYIFDVVGIAEEDYSKILDELVSDNIINFYGYQTDVISFYQKCDCLVLPSYHEGMANTLLEAASVGRALIASDIPGCREAIEDGTNGYLCKPMDANSLYEGINKFANLDYAKKKQMGGESRNIVEQKFSKFVIVRETMEKIF